MAKRKYRLIGGNHIEGDITYHSGDIVESSSDLCARFKNKFERLHSDEIAEMKSAPTKPNIPDKDEVSGKDKTEPETSPQDDFTEDDDTKEEVDDEEVDDYSEEGENDEEEEQQEDFGRDATDDFEAAAKKGLKVFETSKNWFQVRDPDDNDEILNKKKLRKKQVPAFLEQYEDEGD